MLYSKVTKDVYSVGVLNPNMRVFDVIMKTEYGTSYNAYLIKGSEKNALVETVHRDYLNSLLDNLRAAQGQAGDVKIDYLIMNHNEPDHSGAIAELLDIFPDITIVVSRVGSVYLKNITNRTDYNVMIAKDGDTIDLGGKTLRFINAPFLHWPDSMFTYLEEDKVLFSCDFLGAHFCEPQAIDTGVKHKTEYEDAFENYYQAIFGPFPTYVKSGLDKIKDLDLNFACTSHGPVLSKGVLLEEAISKYAQWSTPEVKEVKSIPLFYCSAYGNTEALAEAIAAGIREVIADADVSCYNVIEHDMAQLGALMNKSDAFLVGSPTINRDAVPPLYILLAHAEAINMAKRPVGVFGSFGWSGEAFANLRGRLSGLKTSLFEEDFRVAFVPTDEDLEQAREYGRKFAAWLA